MCFGTTARPPLPPIAGRAGIAGSERLVLEASDGNRFNAFSARAADPDAPGIMILPDVRGLHPFYEDLATRFAEAGVHATAMDYFGRTAGLDERDADFDHWAHVKQITVDGLGADTAATIAHIRSAAGGGAERVYSVGFCMGGRISFNQAWRDHGLAGVIGFYGGPQGRGPDDDTAPVRLAPAYRSGARPLRRRRRGHPAGSDRRVQAGARRRPGAERDGGVRRRPPLVLRPKVRGAPGGVRRRLAADAAVRGQVRLTAASRDSRSPGERRPSDPSRTMVARLAWSRKGIHGYLHDDFGSRADGVRTPTPRASGRRRHDGVVGGRLTSL
jgi:dienelactone hydrolase